MRGGSAGWRERGEQHVPRTASHFEKHADASEVADNFAKSFEFSNLFQRVAHVAAKHRAITRLQIQDRTLILRDVENDRILKRLCLAERPVDQVRLAFQGVARGPFYPALDGCPQGQVHLEQVPLPTPVVNVFLE